MSYRATGERESIITSAVGERNMQPWVSRAPSENATHKKTREVGATLLVRGAPYKNINYVSSAEVT